MKNENASERVAALINETIAALQRIEDAPTSPVNGRLSADRRREHRRAAARLRRGQLEPRYRNLHTAEQLADIYEQTARRDEILEQAGLEFMRISREIRRVVEHEGPAAVRTFNTMFRRQRTRPCSTVRTAKPPNDIDECGSSSRSARGTNSRSAGERPTRPCSPY
jgi:hypothetical protein